MTRPFKSSTAQQTGVEYFNSKELNEHVLQSVKDGIHVISTTGVILAENDAAIKMLGWDNDCLIGKPAHQTIHHHHGDHSRFPVEECPIYATLRDGQTRHVADDVFWRKDGTSFPVEYTAAPLVDNSGRLYGATVIFRDIAERKAEEARVLRMAQYCPLTDLPNRTLYSDRLAQALRRAERDRSKLAVMFVDLDNFKPINDRFGHAVGDCLLREAACRMTQCVRETDTVARIGGDEFVVLLPLIAAREDARAVGARICEALARPFALGEAAAEISVSIGIAVFPEHGTSELSLAKSADQAMYRIKLNGRNGLGFCSGD